MDLFWAPTGVETLTHECQHLSDQGISTPVGAQKRSMEPPPKKTTFSQEFCNKIYIIYGCAIKNYISEKNYNVVPFQNGG